MFARFMLASSLLLVCAASCPTSGNDWELTGNSGTVVPGNFLGTIDRVPLEIRVFSQRAMRIEPSGASPNLIGGFSGNSVGPGIVGASILGGGAYGKPNTVRGHFATIGGGSANQAGGTWDTICGGGMNQTGGICSTVAGGQSNAASADFCFAAGRRAKSNHTGAFVWSDSADADFASTGANQFLIRASGGVGIGRNNPASALDVNGTVALTGFAMPTGAGSGEVLTCDASGIGTWKPVPQPHMPFWKLTGNSGTHPSTDFIGTTDNAALNVRVNNARAFRIEPNAQSPNIIGGFNANSVTAGSVGAVIGGGGTSLRANSVTASYGTIGGGLGNTASGADSTVAGGGGNTASNQGAAVGGGDSNAASGDQAVVAGGENNIASGTHSAVLGGYTNTATGYASTVLGGEVSAAQGMYSFAAGHRARANHQGATVWADSTNADFASTAADQFLIRASGGVGIGKTDPATALDVNGTATLTGFAMPTGAGAGKVLTCDASGIGTWQPVPQPQLPSWNLTGNSGTDPLANFIGTTDNVAFEVRVNSARALRIEPNAAGPNVIGGWNENNVPASIHGATISGGGKNLAPNFAGAHYAAIGGGSGNSAYGSYSTIAGGDGNSTMLDLSTVGGGSRNEASGVGAVVAGGGQNAAAGDYSSVLGGSGHVASGYASVVAGGLTNQALGNYSFAAGYQARADHTGTFVWADWRSPAFHSAAQNEFSARATGGVRFVSAIDGSGNPSAGVVLAPGAGSWSSVSDRKLKANFARVDGQEVLRKLASIPIETWNLTSQDPSIRHIGPVAQDFAAAFRVGEDNTRISTVDADGVALAALQGVYQLLQKKDTEIRELKLELAELKKLVSR